MSHIIDFSVYFTKEDLLSIDKSSLSSMLVKEIERINREILAIIDFSHCPERNVDYLYKLSINLEMFVKQYGRELKFLHRLKIEMLELLIKISKLNNYKKNLTTALLDSIAHLLQIQIGKHLPDNMINDLVIFETFEYLGVISELSIQGKLLIVKVRDVETYSMLLTKYKKPKILKEHLDYFFTLNRNEMLLKLVDTTKNIKHIHYDFEYLQQFISLKLLLNLMGEDINTYINQQVKNAFI